MFGIDSNRKVSLEKGIWHQIRQLAAFENSQKMWLKDFEFVQSFKTQLKEQQRFYIVYDADEYLTIEGLQNLQASHWKIEQYHRYH